MYSLLLYLHNHGKPFHNFQKFRSNLSSSDPMAQRWYSQYHSIGIGTVVDGSRLKNTFYGLSRTSSAHARFTQPRWD
jgi:hypothetical protein